MENHLPSWLHRHRGEHRWPAALVVVLCILLQSIQTKHALSENLRITFLIVESLLLVVLFVFNPTRINRLNQELRNLSLTLLGVITVGNVFCIWVLIKNLLFMTDPITPAKLLLNGGTIWIINILLFGLWFWELDRKGPAARANGIDAYPDFLFPQMENSNLAHPGWRPVFMDYLYVAFTNGTAFSPTDTEPLSSWAKVLMAIESAISLLALVVVIARAINLS